MTIETKFNLKDKVSDQITGFTGTITEILIEAYSSEPMYYIETEDNNMWIKESRIGAVNLNKEPKKTKTEEIITGKIKSKKNYSNKDIADTINKYIEDKGLCFVDIPTPEEALTSVMKKNRGINLSKRDKENIDFVKGLYELFDLKF